MGDIKMSARGRKRLEMLSRVKKDALITQAKGSELSGIGYRHTRRVCERYGEEGDGGPIRGNRSRASRRRIEEKSSENDCQAEAIGREPEAMETCSESSMLNIQSPELSTAAPRLRRAFFAFR